MHVETEAGVESNTHSSRCKLNMHTHAHENAGTVIISQ